MLWYAPDSAYGRPEDLKALIDEAHLRGLMVFLDVVYNHFGPEGNYLGRYAPRFFTEAHTPWGSAIDYRVPQVRAFAIENALHWLRDYRFDGLRLDAVNSIVEPGGLSLLNDLSMAVGELAAETGRHIHLVLENGDNRASILDAAQDPPRGKYRAQWNDDYHHAWRVLMTGEKQGYYCDYQRSPLRRYRPVAVLGLCLPGRNVGISRRQARRAERHSSRRPPSSISCRTTTRSATAPLATGSKAWRDPEAIEAALAVMLLAPAIPMLFMGEEWGSKTPFPFFCDFKGDLADAVRKGRRSEYAWAYAEYGDEVPDALAPSTFQSAVLDWNERAEPAAQQRLALVQQMLAIRRREIVPRLAGASFGEAKAAGNGLLTADWRMGDGATLRLLANLSDRDDRQYIGRIQGNPYLGQRVGRRASRHGRCTGASDRKMPPAIPIATYRLQLSADFDFDAAAAVVPYLRALGITHLYASPFMKARKGSTHGYDIIDHAKLNPELGGEAGFERLSAALRKHDLGLILDFVPNHVGVHFADNPWWLDVLEWGQASPHAVSFDIDWELLPYRARGGVLLPIIGSSYGQALESGEIELRYDAGEGSFSAWYFEHRLPIAPERYSEILRTIVRQAERRRQPGRQGHPRPRRALPRAAPPQPEGSPRVQGGAAGDRGQRRDHRARDRRLSRRTGSSRADAGAASSARTPALQARPLAAGFQRHQLPPLLRRQFAGGIARRGRRHLRGDPSAGQAADRGGQAAGPAARPHRRPARSRAIFSAPAPPDPRRAGQPSRFTW